MKLDKKGISTVAVVLIVIMLIAIVAVSAYISTNNPGNDRSPDSAAQGKMGVGTTFEYRQVGYGEVSGKSTSFTKIYVTIIGQGPAHYLEQVRVEWNRTSTYGSSSDDFIVEINKTTGGLNHSTKIGKDSMQYNGKTVSLDRWELKMIDVTISISSGPQDSIPYRIQYSSDWVSFFAELSSTHIIEDHAKYVKPDDVGKGLVYSMIDPDKGTGTATLSIVGETINSRGEKQPVLCGHADLSGGMFVGYVALKPGEGIKDFLMLANLEMTVKDFKSNKTPARTERISTIDGNVYCEVFENKGWYYSTVYIGQSNNVVYIFEFSDGTIFTLQKYL
jgi:hypothetical protein